MQLMPDYACDAAWEPGRARGNQAEPEDSEEAGRSQGSQFQGLRSKSPKGKGLVYCLLTGNLPFLDSGCLFWLFLDSPASSWLVLAAAGSPWLLLAPSRSSSHKHRCQIREICKITATFPTKLSTALTPEFRCSRTLLQSPPYDESPQQYKLPSSFNAAKAHAVLKT